MIEGSFDDLNLPSVLTGNHAVNMDVSPDVSVKDEKVVDIKYDTGGDTVLHPVLCGEVGAHDPNLNATFGLMLIDYVHRCDAGMTK